MVLAARSSKARIVHRSAGFVRTHRDRRNADKGDTRRTASSGRRAKTRATQSPMPMPRPAAFQERLGATSTGSRPDSTDGPRRPRPPRIPVVAVARASDQLAHVGTAPSAACLPATARTSRTSSAGRLGRCGAHAACQRAAVARASDQLARWHATWAPHLRACLPTTSDWYAPSPGTTTSCPSARRWTPRPAAPPDRRTPNTPQRPRQSTPLSAPTWPRNALDRARYDHGNRYDVRRGRLRAAARRR